jgi:hypothetical protein
MNAVEPVDLIALIDERLEKVRSRSLDISFNELLDMQSDEELIIEPEYQRLFRWDEIKQSRFIESVLLEMPIPPIYVIELTDNKYELIDGLQRISTWMHFRGRHPLRRDPTTGHMTALVLNDCDIVHALNGLTYDTLPSALKIKLKRHFIRVEVIRKESDARLRYYMFKRLNTGGEQLSEQEVRNCTIRLLDNSVNDLITKLATDEAFGALTDTISENKKERMYREELVLRFIALKNGRDAYEHIVGEFLTAYMERVSDPKVDAKRLDLAVEESCFRKTFKVLQAALGERAFSTVTPLGTLTATFSVLHFEALSLGLQNVLETLNPQDAEQMARLGEALTDVKKSEELRKVVVGGGQNYAGPLLARISIVADYLKKTL